MSGLKNAKRQAEGMTLVPIVRKAMKNQEEPMARRIAEEVKSYGSSWAGLKPLH